VRIIAVIAASPASCQRPHSATAGVIDDDSLGWKFPDQNLVMVAINVRSKQWHQALLIHTIKADLDTTNEPSANEAAAPPTSSAISRPSLH